MNPSRYAGNIVADLKPGEVEPWADALFKQRSEAFGRDNPANLQCLPQGPTANLFSPMLEKIVQTPGLVIILMEDLTFRQVFLDGRDLPPDPNPSWFDMGGHPHTEALRITERFRRLDFGHLEIEETLQDPKVYARSWTINLQADLAADTEMIEYVCAENEKDRQHLVGKASNADDNKHTVKVAPEVLSRYAGTYECFTCIPENPVAVVRYTITVSGGELLRNGAPLTPLSDKIFSAGGNRIEFVTNAQGVAEYFKLQLAEGEMKAIRKPDLK